MKRVLKITGVTLGVILLLLFVLPFAFRGKIVEIVKEEGNRMLNARFDFRTVNISLLRNFPSASVSLKDFWVKGTGEFEDVTLVSAGEITAAVNLMSLFGDDGYDITKIILSDISLNAIVLEDGRPNWDIMKHSDDAPEEEVEEAPAEDNGSPIRIKLRKLSVNDLSVIYDDRQRGMYAALQHFNALCSGDLSGGRTVVEMSMDTPSLTFRMGGVPFLNNAEIEADIDVDADFAENRYTLQDNSIRLNAIQAGVDGWVALKEDGMDMDINLNTNDIGFKEVLSLIPAVYTKDFKELKTGGSARLTAFAKGTYSKDGTVPQFDVLLDVKDAMFRYPSLPAGVDGINISVAAKNPGGNVDATTVDVKPFEFVLAGNPFSVNASVKTPVSDPDFLASAKGKLDLGKVKDVYPMEDMQLNGMVNADVSVSGRLSYIEKEQFDRIKAKGGITLNDMKLSLKDMPEIDIRRSTFNFTPEYLRLSETTVNVGDNDLTVDSRLENYLGFVLKGTTLKGSLNVNSNRLNLNDFMSGDDAGEQPEEKVKEEKADTAAAGVIRVPENIDFNMQVAMKEVLFSKMKFDNVSGHLVVKDGKVDMRNISLNTMGGSVVVNGAYSAPADVQPELNAGFELKNIGFAQAYRELDMVQQLAPIFAGLNGNFSGHIRVDTPLDDSMSPVLGDLSASGSLSTRDLSLSGVKFIDQLADIVKKPELKDMRAKDLDIGFEIKDGRINTRPFDLTLGDYSMNLSGSTGLDRTIDYKGRITMPAGTALSSLGTVDMNIGGTFASPKVSVDMESLARNAAKQAATEIGKEIGKQLDITPSEPVTKEDVLDKVTDFLKKKKK